MGEVDSPRLGGAVAIQSAITKMQTNRRLSIMKSMRAKNDVILQKYAVNFYQPEIKHKRHFSTPERQAGKTL